MRSIQVWVRGSGAILTAVGALLLLEGCSKPESETGSAAPTPQKAAVQVEKVFATAPPDIRQPATAASQALRAGDYEGAIESFAKVRKAGEVTMEQGMAIQRAMVSMEKELMQKVEAGDPKAKQAYELLRQRNRN